MKKYVIQFVFLSFVFQVYCQYPEINSELISTKQGLPEESIPSMVQDNKGFLWVGGYRLHKYDGYTFTTLADSSGNIVYPTDTLVGINSMITDDLGILWIVYNEGIVLFDPERQKSVLFKPLKKYTAYNAVGKNIIKDSRGNIWISCGPGLIKVAYKRDLKMTVTKEMIFANKIDSIYAIDTVFSPEAYTNHNLILSIIEDSHGNIWAGTFEGLYFLRNGEKPILRLDDDKNGNSRLMGCSIDKILQENDDTFLTSNWNGFTRINNVRKALMGVTPDKSLLEFSKIEQLSWHPTELIMDRKKNILVGSTFDLFLMKNDAGNDNSSFLSLLSSTKEKNDYGPFILKIMQDHTGVIWAGQLSEGIVKFNLERSQFISYKKLFGGNGTDNVVGFIYEDPQDNLWISASERLYKIQANNYKITPYNAVSGMCMAEIRPGFFWVGTNGGLVEFNTHNGKYYDPFPKTETSKKLSNSQIFDILKDSNQVFLCTQSGVFVYDFQTRKLLHFSSTEDASYGDPGNNFLSIIKSQDGSIWTVSNGNPGLYKLIYNASSESLSFVPFTSPFLSSQNISGNNNEVLYQDRQGLFWVANLNLHSINIQTGEIRSFDLDGKLGFSGISSILEDDHFNLWLGTATGLFQFNTKTKQIKSFSRDDGLPIRGHGHHSAFKSRNGRMYFGGGGGFYSFYPDSLKINHSIPPIVITDFRLFNKSVKVGTTDKAILTKDISYTHVIELSHEKNDVSFEFAALDYNRPMNNKYAYKLEGYQDYWVKTDAKNRVAAFTNLDPGTYIFRVKGSNSDGVWNEQGTSLKIIIHKPWWGTTLAWVIYILTVLGTIGGLTYRREWKLKKEKQVLENQVRERTRQIEEQKEEILSQRDMVEQQNHQIVELDQLRSRFFTNVSHEFRTPLALIQSPVEELLDDPHSNDKQRRKLNIVQRNAARLLSLVNQLLDISKMDGSSMKLELVEADLMKHLKALAGSFTSLAETKSIHYELQFPDEECKDWFDADKLEKIAVNLLSNAFKFTPEGGDIIFKAQYSKSLDSQSSGCLEFSVKDTGTGIPAESLEKIFDRFYQVESSVKKEGGGTGIGLSLARDMARLMHGDITVESEICKGSIFSVQIPLGKDHLNESEFILTKGIREFSAYVPELLENKEKVLQEQDGKSTDDKPILLIVEDNRDIRLQLADNLSNEYLIIEAIDGVAGMKKATEMIPDLIITDIMMPRMDGTELCNRLKNDERTSHIPVIMLTAKVTSEARINGFHTGADDYMPKPFHMAELKARIANLIEQRKKLRERFSREITLEPMDITITSLDEKFLKRAIETVEKHISEEKFDLPEFRSEMNMSRSTLFRKLQALTGQSPSDFIRTIRLKRAASLLKQNFGNVTQVSYEVGFYNLSYFNRSFKKTYGVTPAEFIKSH